jgi:dCMP deaminase
MNIAEAAAQRSEDPYVKVGSCLLGFDNAVVSVGYNGAPAGVDIDWSDRDGRRKLVIHAESNCLRWATPSVARGGLLATTHHPCVECVRSAAAYGVRDVVWRYELETTTYDIPTVNAVARVLGVELHRI